MDNVTHSLFGLAAAKAGLDRVSPYATATCIIASNLPDADLLGAFGGRWFYFQHHRGITHSLVGVLALGLLLPTLFYLFDYWRARREARAVRVRWGPLACASLLLTASHPFLDWTNNYGVRPFLPWDGTWHYGDLTFVVDPLFWLLLGLAGFVTTARTRLRVAVWVSWWTLALVLLIIGPALRNVSLPAIWLFIWLAGGLVAWQLHRRYAGAQGRRVAATVLGILAVYLVALVGLQQYALRLARVQAAQLVVSEGGTGNVVNAVAAMPMPGNPLRWLCLAVTPNATYRYELAFAGAPLKPPARFANVTPQEQNQVAQAFAQDARARIWRDFARFPAARVTGSCATQTLVQLADLRYAEPDGRANGSFALTVPLDCEPEKGNR